MQTYAKIKEEINKVIQQGECDHDFVQNITTKDRGTKKGRRSPAHLQKCQVSEVSR